MATVSSTQQQMNLSFMSYNAALQQGEKSTISNLAASVSKTITNDIFQATASQSPLSSFGTITYSNGGRSISITDTRRAGTKDSNSSGWKEYDPYEFISKRIYSGQENENQTRFGVDFSVDAEVANPGDKQTQDNLAQAAQIKRQMGIQASDQSLESLAQDLAVFGMDFSVFEDDNPEALVERIQERTLEMLDKFAAEGGSVAERNRITGASARLVNGIQSSAGAFFRVDSTVEADVGGTSINGDAAYSVASVVVDPLVLDLAGDGINLSSAEEGVAFDMDGDGEKTQMGFIQGDDALLFLDENGDGVATDGRELFGNTDGHANGFEKLASYDDNGDGVINRDDKVWDSLRVWVEKTADGVNTEDETMTLDEAGIESINVAYDNVREDDGTGNLIGQTGEFKRTDGTKGRAADAWLRQLGAGYPRPE